MILRYKTNTIQNTQERLQCSCSTFFMQSNSDEHQILRQMYIYL